MPQIVGAVVLDFKALAQPAYIDLDQTAAGLAAAKARGRKGGRKAKMDASKISADQFWVDDFVRPSRDLKAESERNMVVIKKKWQTKDASAQHAA